jgi:hypothetical protein
METPEQSRVLHRITSTTPTVPDYRPLIEVETGQLAMPAKCTVNVEVVGEPGLAHVELIVELIERRYCVTRLTASPQPGHTLDMEQVRGLDVAYFVRHGVAHKVLFQGTDGKNYSSSYPMQDPDPLWEVALTYSVAFAIGESPTAAVARDLRISHAAAAQRVKRAREKGLLPPTRKGSAS